jgi:electron transfer flavoprotein alpha/beta subunit
MGEVFSPCVLGIRKEANMPRGVKEGSKRDRQYEHIKESYEERGVSKDEAEERAARTVNKERREAGETKKEK